MAALKILMASSEAVPYAKSGGLGDVVGALTDHLSTRGIDVRIILPRYQFIDSASLAPLLSGISVPVGFDDPVIDILEGRMPESGAPVYFIEHPLFSDSSAIYGTGDHAYVNNALRFSLLGRAIFPVCRKTGWIPDIIHSHDWPTGLVPAFLKIFESGPPFQHTRTIHSIHNLGYQGVFSKHDIHETRLTLKEAYNGLEEGQENLNFLLSGLVNADYLTTVSPTYAREIQTPEHGFGLHRILSQRSDTLSGILNGIDYSIWNPETDPALVQNFSSASLEGKKKNKTAVASLCNFSNPDLPLFATISRLVEQKGFRDLFKNGHIDSLLSEGKLNYVILGTGESWAENRVEELNSRYANFRGFIKFDEDLAHLIEAGSDFFVMPSRYEPCGLNQLYSLRYGTIPVVTRTGGLADTVVPIEAEGATGIHINGFGGEKITAAVRSAVELWNKNPGLISEIQKRGMEKHFGWNESADAYISLYEELAEKAAP